jgi:hypothetical protein
MITKKTIRKLRKILKEKLKINDISYSAKMGMIHRLVDLKFSEEKLNESN